MIEVARHWPGRIFLLVLLLSVVGFIVFLVAGGTDAPVEGEPILLFGWMTMSLLSGFVFVFVWLVSYLIYFFGFWPYR